MVPSIRASGGRVDLVAGADIALLPVGEEMTARFAQWQERYRQHTAQGDQGLLRVLGLEMFAWLDSAGWMTWWRGLPGPRRLEIQAESPPTAEQRLVLDLPWEVLSDKQGFLAQDATQPFEVWRRIGTAQAAETPRFRDLSLLFMAAAPRGVEPELDFEAEEAAILTATERLDLALFVEESGCPEELGHRTLGEEGFDAFHFSCHGTVLDEEQAAASQSRGAKTGPNLVMETEEGEVAYVPPSRLSEVWEGRTPQLVFLSACKTAQCGEGVQNAFTAELVRAVPAVIGWSGSVYDTDATAFSAEFYARLAGRHAVTAAAARARRKVLETSAAGGGRGAHWHLARVWLGPQGGGPICDAEGESRRLPRQAGYKPFLDKKAQRSPVASSYAFVGRRRLLQNALRALRTPDRLGVLLLGMGNLGKSSLAARIANRMPRCRTVVIVNAYDAPSIFHTVCEELPPDQRQIFRDQWDAPIRRDPAALAPALEALLGGPLADQPILLVIDDVEQVLNDPQQGETACTLKEEGGHAAAIRAVLQAFKKAGGANRLLLTSRYDFVAPLATGEDPAGSLDRLYLPPFTPRERDKQWRAELNLRLLSEDQTLRQAAENALAEEDYPRLRAQIMSLAAGNPGLQDLFGSRLLSHEFGAVRAALGALREFIEDSDRLPAEENAAFEFIRRMAFEKYGHALTKTQRDYLRAAMVFGDGAWPEEISAMAVAALERYQRTPVPIAAGPLDAVGAAGGIGDTSGARRRLVGLGLLDVYDSAGFGRSAPEYLVNRFARPLVDALTAEERAMLAAAAVPALETLWAQDDEEWPEDRRSVEALRLALLADKKP